jgi:hypothetical protein
MPGWLAANQCVIIVPQWLAIGLAAEDLSIIAECSTPSDWANQVGFLPLRTSTSGRS